jgi:hypothetical protein
MSLRKMDGTFQSAPELPDRVVFRESATIKPELLATAIPAMTVR